MMLNNNRFQNRNSSSPKLQVDREQQHIHYNCDRFKRFTQFLENRGCPVKLVFHEPEREIRWLG